MHPYEELTYLLDEYKRACDIEDDPEAFSAALRISHMAHNLVIRAARVNRPPVDDRQLKLSLEGAEE